MLFRHYQLRLILAICVVVISHGEYIEDEIQITIPHHSPANEVSSITYIDRSNTSLFIRQHIQIENKTRHIYISPLALLDINQTKLILNRTTIIIPLILYTDEQINFIREHNTNQCKQGKTKCLFHGVSTTTMRVIYQYKLDQTVLSNSDHQYINSIWLSYNPVLNPNLLYVHIDCRSNETCLRFNEILHQSKTPIGLHLEYAIQPAEQHPMIISYKHLLKTTIYSSSSSPSKFILEHDVEQVLQEVLYAADVWNNGTYVLSQIDLFLLKENLRKQLLGKSLILTDEQQWNLIYWENNETIRPDHLLKLLKKKINSKYLSKNFEMDNYVRQIYDKQSLDLYLKYRHLFELHQINGTQGESVTSLKLKPILVYELNEFNRSSFLVHQPMHMTKREDIHLIPIRSILPLKETQQLANQPDDSFSILDRIQRAIENIRKMIIDYQSITTSSTTEITSTIQSPTTAPSATAASMGVTVAGGRGRGSASNQLHSPRSLVIDDDQNLVIADTGNHRIVQWKCGAIKGQVVAGGNNKGDGLDQLNHPTSVVIDKVMDSLIICDSQNRRVVQWYRRSGTTQGEILIGNISCEGLAIDDQGGLYISSGENKQEVRRFEREDNIGTIVAGGHGPGTGLNQCDNPFFIFVDQQQNVYVADNRGHRIMKWSNGAKEGIVVAGGHGRGNGSAQFDHPNGLFVDTKGTLYVADDSNSRVMCWPQGAQQGIVVAGGNGWGEAANQFRGVADLSFDRHGQLYVVDGRNDRVQRFSIK